ncbi:MAG: alpha/beta hydrolase [Planctomycetota bacterium]|nr:MAG: alpha/beta hydrolase [Planctomycetota bacterium]
MSLPSPWRSGGRRAWRIARPLLAIYLTVVLMFALLERLLVYPAPRLDGADCVAADLPYEDVFFAAEDGTRLHGWYVPHPQPRAVVLFAHGNGENVASLAPLLRLLHDRVAVTTFAWDYRGYGRSGGKPHEENLLSDARTAQRWLAARAGVRPEDVVVYGRSLGGGVAVGLASQHLVRGLVLERTFAGLVETAAHHFPWLPVRWLMKNRFPSIERIASYRGPLLQSHGTADEVVPFDMGRRLFEAAGSANKRFITCEGADHNCPQPDDFYDALVEFLDSLPPVADVALAETAAPNGHAPRNPR